MNHSFDPSKFDLVTPRQELLLKAALLSGEEAIFAWKAWQKQTDWNDHLDQGSFRLLPLVYTNLFQYGIDDPVMGRLKGIYRNAWSKNQTLFHEMAGVVNDLQQEGIRTMLLKGASLSLLYYKNNGARPMADIDVLVPLEQARWASDLLQKAGWMPSIPISDLDLNFGHAVQLKNNREREFDLHWRPFNSCSDDLEKYFWNEAVPVKMAGVLSMAPDPTKMLFHVIIHGMTWNAVPSIRWVADAFTLVHSNQCSIDWQQLINLAQKNLFSLRLKNGLQYLQDVFHACIPHSVMKAIKDLPISYLEKIEYRFMIKNRDLEGSGPYAAFCCHLCRFRRLNSGNRNFPVGKFSRSLHWRMNAQNSYDLACKGLRFTASTLLSRPFQVRRR